MMLIRGIIRTIKCHIESSTQEPLSDESYILLWLVAHAGYMLSRCQKGRDGKTPFERLHGKKPTQKFVPFGDTSSGFELECETTVQNVSLLLQVVYSELVKSEDWNFKPSTT